MYEVKQRLQEYTNELFDDNRQPFELDLTNGGVPIQRSGIEAAVKQMKKEKVIGEEGWLWRWWKCWRSGALMLWCNWEI